jgi:hypothetical protein
LSELTHCFPTVRSISHQKINNVNCGSQVINTRHPLLVVSVNLEIYFNKTVELAVVGSDPGLLKLL